MKKSIIIATSLTILWGMAGCTSSENRTDKVDNKEEITMTIHGGTVEAGPFNGEWPVFMEAAEKTGVP